MKAVTSLNSGTGMAEAVSNVERISQQLVLGYRDITAIVFGFTDIAASMTGINAILGIPVYSTPHVLAGEIVRLSTGSRKLDCIYYRRETS